MRSSTTRMLRLVGVAFVGGLFAVAGAGATSTGVPVSSTLIESWDGTGWTQQASPSPGGHDSGSVGSFAAVTTLSTTSAWAVGSYGSQGVDARALAAHWDGSAWRRVAIPTPAKAVETHLNGVAAVSSRDIWAVGDWVSASTAATYRTLIEHWNGTSWTVVPSPSSHAAAALYGVAALSASHAWAVGCTGASLGRGHALVLAWNGKRWTSVGKSPSGGASCLEGVAAVSPRSVWAVGHAARGSGATRTLTLHWNGRTWQRVPSPNRSGSNALSAVAAIGPSNVWTVGGYGAKGDCCNGGGRSGRLLAERWNGHAWHVVPARSGFPISATQALTSLAVVSGRDIWAAGYHQDAHSLCRYGLLEHWDGDAWSPIPSASPDTDHFAEIAAAARTAVWAVGASSGSC